MKILLDKEIMSVVGAAPCMCRLLNNDGSTHLHSGGGQHPTAASCENHCCYIWNADPSYQKAYQFNGGNIVNCPYGPQQKGGINWGVFFGVKLPL